MPVEESFEMVPDQIEAEEKERNGHRHRVNSASEKGTNGKKLPELHRRKNFNGRKEWSVTQLMRDEGRDSRGTYIHTPGFVQQGVGFRHARGRIEAGINASDPRPTKLCNAKPRLREMGNWPEARTAAERSNMVSNGGVGRRASWNGSAPFSQVDNFTH